MGKNDKAVILNGVGTVFFVMGAIAAIGVFSKYGADLWILALGLIICGFLIRLLFVSMAEVITLLQENVDNQEQIVSILRKLSDKNEKENIY